MAVQTNQCILPLLAHVVTSKSLGQFLIMFVGPTVSPPPLTPDRRPNMNETRNNCKMFGARRSPPPATNGNRASYTPQRVQCFGRVKTLGNAFFCL